VEEGQRVARERQAEADQRNRAETQARSDEPPRMPPPSGAGGAQAQGAQAKAGDEGG
jgi:hypothetical protein